MFHCYSGTVNSFEASIKKDAQLRIMPTVQRGDHSLPLKSISVNIPWLVNTV